MCVCVGGGGGGGGGYSYEIFTFCFPPGHLFLFFISNLMFAYIYMIAGGCDVLWFWLGVYRLASNPVRCDLVLYVDSEIVIILSLSFIR